MKKIILLLIIISINIKASENYFIIQYKVKTGDTFGKILSQYLKTDSFIRKNTPMVMKIRKDNPHIQNWKNLKKGDLLKISLKVDLVHQKKLKGKNLKQWKKNYTNKGFHYSLFYMASSGSLKQIFSNNFEFSYDQISLLTLGGFISYHPQFTNYFLSSSIYFSSFAKGTEKALNKLYSPPLEIGINLYGQFQLKNMGISLYSGIDYDHFGTLDKDELISTSSLKNIYNNHFYLTLGLQKNFKIKSHPFMTRISYAKGLFSIINESNQSYKGHRFLFFLSYKLHRKMGINFLFKYHTMSGPDDLTILRYGLGASYFF